MWFHFSNCRRSGRRDGRVDPPAHPRGAHAAVLTWVRVLGLSRFPRVSLGSLLLCNGATRALPGDAPTPTPACLPPSDSTWKRQSDVERVCFRFKENGSETWRTKTTAH